MARVAVAGMAVGTPLAIAATPAQASDTNWDAVAQCESGGNWSTSTGNGYSGGLQFSPSTWKAYGGSGSPQNASRSEQIQVAEKVKSGQGMSAWPNCGKKGSSSSSYKSSNTGSSSKSSSSSSSKSSSSSSSKKSDSSSSKSSSSSKKSTSSSSKSSSKTATTAKSNPNGDYTVKQGDTLSKIAKENSVDGGYSKLKQLNKGYISDADMIVVGQQIATK